MKSISQKQAIATKDAEDLKHAGVVPQQIAEKLHNRLDPSRACKVLELVK